MLSRDMASSEERLASVSTRSITKHCSRHCKTAAVAAPRRQFEVLGCALSHELQLEAQKIHGVEPAAQHRIIEQYAAKATEKGTWRR